MSPDKQIVRRGIAHVESGDGAGHFDHTLHPLLKRLYAHRHISSSEQLDHSLHKLLTPSLLKGIDTATGLLFDAIKLNRSILIVGDYDTDGATAATVAILGLQLMGATDVRYLVPNRFDFGYGLSVGIAEVALTMKPELVITVDNGISSIEGIDLLRSAGIDVIVTDHHIAGLELPAASAIVNPNQPGCMFPSKMLAGVGVMFYVLLGLRSLMRDAGWFDQQQTELPNLAQLIDLVALGTVADVVPLDHNNRILVAQGIARIHKGHCRPGVRALLEIAGKSHKRVSSSDLGFVVAPRLNAAGRLDDISMGIECLLTDDPEEALGLASVLHDINNERKQIESQMQNQAMEVVHKLSDTDDLLSGICLYNTEWHQGITGLVASRVKDRFHQPTVVFASIGEGNLTGSARSIPGLNIRDLLEQVSTANPNLIHKFGGHAMAAGLTISTDKLDQFCSAFKQDVRAHFEENPPANEIYTDGPLEPEFFTREIAELLRNAAPWGQHFPAPLFDNVFRVIQQKVVGGQHLKLRLATRDRVVEGIAFRQLEPGATPPKLDWIKAAFQLDVNEFRGVRALQLIIDYLEPVDAPESC